MRRLRARGGELDRKGKVVEARAQLGDVSVGSAERSQKEGNGLGLSERGHRVLDLALYTQELAARDEQGEIGAGADEGLSSDAASITCSRLSRRMSSSRSPMCSARPSSGEGCDRLRDERRIADAARPTQWTPSE